MKILSESKYDEPRFQFEGWKRILTSNVIVLKDGRFSTFKKIDPHNRKRWRLAMGFERLLLEK